VTLVNVEPIRTRLVRTLFAGVAVGRIAFIMAITIGTLAAEDLTGSERWAGAPSAITTLGTAVGATALGALALRMGRTNAFSMGYATSAIGAAMAAGAIAWGSFVLLLAGSFLVGLGQATSHLARYAAADLRDAHRRASAISFIVWAGTIGSVVGPTLLDPLGSVADARGLPELVGPYAGAAALFAIAVILFFVALRPEPLTVSVMDAGDEQAHARPRRSTGELLGLSTVRFALMAMVVGQVVMVAVMTVTPLHIRHAGQALTSVGIVITAHTLGMFAFAPLTGWLVSRFGTVRMVIVGAGLLIASCLASALAAGDQTTLLVISLFGLGLGWNMGFVAGSTHLLTNLSLSERLHIQGVTDTFVWVSAGVASLSSGVLVEAFSYGTASYIGAALAFIPLAAALAARRAVSV